MASKSVTIHDVARKAGVVVSTASKALNNRPGISPELRALIVAAADDLNYVPHAMLRSSRRGGNKTIGVYLWNIFAQPFLSVSIEPELIRGFSDAISALDGDMLLYSFTSKSSSHNMPKLLLDGRVDGVVLFERSIDQNGLIALANAGLPTVVICSRNVPDNIGYVALDNRAGIHAAIDHLVDLGHRQIAYYAFDRMHDFVERGELCMEILALHGIDMDPAMCIIADNFKPDINRACDILRGLNPMPTAVIVGNDMTAFKLIKAFRDVGVRVPEDISVVGFDGVALDYSIPISSVRVSVADIAKYAVSFIGDMIGGTPASECRIVLPTRFEASESSGPAPNR